MPYRRALLARSRREAAAHARDGASGDAVLRAGVEKSEGVGMNFLETAADFNAAMARAAASCLAPAYRRDKAWVWSVRPEFLIASAILETPANVLIECVVAQIGESVSIIGSDFEGGLVSNANYVQVNALSIGLWFIAGPEHKRRDAGFVADGQDNFHAVSMALRQRLASQRKDAS